MATDENQGDISEGLVKKPEQDAEIPHQFEDNRFMEHVSDHFVNTVADNHFELQNEHFEDDEPELANKIDFAEKKVFSTLNPFDNIHVIEKRRKELFRYLEVEWEVL